MQYIKNTGLALFALLLVPSVTHAENIENLKSLIAYAKEILNSIIPLLFGIAVVVFIWGVIKYMYADGTTKLAEARNYIIFSVIAITVMLSIWSIALMLRNTFFGGTTPTYTPGRGVNTSGDIETPTHAEYGEPGE